MLMIWYVQLATTWFMTGLIWLIQVVHYPLFAQVGRAQFREYHIAHSRLITFIVMPVMTVELVTAALLVFSPTPKLWNGWPVVALVLVVGIWATTAFASVPAHNTLVNGFDANAHTMLVRTNWLRTVGWTVRGGLLLWMFHQVNQGQNIIG